VDRADVVAILLKEFPTLANELTDETWAGLVHLEVGCFSYYTQQQIESGSRAELARCYWAATKFLMDGDDAVRNAIYVSFLEHLNFEDGKRPRRWAKDAMPPRLRAGYEEIIAYNEALARTRT
jgi:hypothetical protein